MARILVSALGVLGFISCSVALDNGLALTPPMGWLTWLKFECKTDCEKYPNECISENLIKRTADRMVSDGYLMAGYEYVGIDDCWLERERGPDGRLVPDRERFPNGMKAVADYIHSKGLKFALYQDYGNMTCMGYPGILGHEKLDIDTFAEWDVDYIKLDGCHVNTSAMDAGYPYVGKLINETGRKIVYSCSWPAYQDNPDYKSIEKHCNLWRNWDDIADSWDSLKTIMNWFGDQDLAKYAGPGHWNDPDMLLIGNNVTVDQARTQMAVWAILAAPLLISADLSTMKKEFRDILINPDVIAIDQDPLGKQGSRVYTDDDIKIWRRQLSGGAYAVALVYQSDNEPGPPIIASFTFDQMQIPDQGYIVTDLYHEEPTRVTRPNEIFLAEINHSGVKFYKFEPIKSVDYEVVQIREIVSNTLDDY